MGVGGGRRGKEIACPGTPPSLTTDGDSVAHDSGFLVDKLKNLSRPTLGSIATHGSDKMTRLVGNGDVSSVSYVLTGSCKDTSSWRVANNAMRVLRNAREF
jgi:hypothetical protein